MIYESYELQRHHVTNFFKNCIGEFDFEVCDGRIPNYKENYFRVYVDGRETEFLELYFVNGKLHSFGYSCKTFSREREHTECGNYYVVTSIPVSVKKFMKHMIEVLGEKDSLNENEKKFLGFIVKNA